MMMGEVEKMEAGTGCDAKAVAAAEEKMAMEGVTVLDFDMLCSKVAKQTQKGTWGRLMNEENEEEVAMLIGTNAHGGGVLRMWEGELVHDFFDDSQIAMQSTCCACYRFGKNMKRAGFRSCFLQGSLYLILAIISVFDVLAFVITGRHCFLYLAIASTVSVGMYAGLHRTQMRRKFNIEGTESSLDDCVYHLICPCCALSQESRTLEMNNVQDGIWHGRRNTICIGSHSENCKALVDLSPPLVVSTQ